MKAARIHAYGEPDELKIEDAPTPQPGPRDLLVEVHAASVNPVDCKMRRGAMRGILRYPMPLTLGLDLSGVVVEVGARCTRFKPGDAVKVVDGPFNNFTGFVDEVYPDKMKVKVMVSIFGRKTPLELDYLQVEHEE